MDREPYKGEVLIVVKDSSNHEFPVGDKLVVCRVDESDETFEGMSRTSNVTSPWIPWGDAEPIAFGWEFVRKHLPADLERLLAACHGIEFISLNSAVKEQILASLPDWAERVDQAIQPLEDMLPTTAADEDEDEDEDEDDECLDDEEDDT